MRRLPSVAGVTFAAVMAFACFIANAMAQRAEQPGAFDYYLMSFTVAPSFCALSSRYAEKQECQIDTDAAFHETPLTVHGLWPNRERVSVNLQPQYCAGPSLGTLSPSLRESLVRYMPGVADGLERYEWRRHGACSGLEPETYFAAVVRLAQHANDTIGAAMRDQLGKDVRIDDLLAAVRAKEPALAAAMVVSCRFSRQETGPSRAYIEEIRVVLSKDFMPEPAERVGFGQNSGCPGRTGFLPDGFGPR